MDNSIYDMLLIFFGIFHENFGILEGHLTTVHVITCLWGVVYFIFSVSNW